MTPATRGVARSLAAAAALRGGATSLLLGGSADLACANVLCGSFPGGCACRLALALSRHGAALEELDVSDAALPALPDAVGELRALRVLRAPRNRLAALPAALRGARALEELDVRDNALAALPLDLLRALPALRRVRASGNPLSKGARDAASAQGLAFTVELE